MFKLHENVNQDPLNLKKESLIISSSDLTRIYMLGETEVVGVEGIDLQIRKGEIVVVKGKSGSGKSTLLSLIGGLDMPTRGHLNVAGHDLLSVTLEELTSFRRKVVGIVFQSFNLLPTLNALENVVLPALLAGKSIDSSREKALQLLEWLGLKHRSSHFPSQLSGGEMQRIAIARSLINDPEILLADEPTGNLDSKSGEAVIRLLVQANRKFRTTVLVATHSNQMDAFATSRILLKDGRVAEIS